MTKFKFTTLVIVLITAIFGTLCLGLAFIGADLGAVIFGVFAVAFGCDAYLRADG